MKKWGLYLSLLIFALILTACGEPYLSTLKPAGEVAERQFNLLLLSTGVMTLVIVVVVIIYVIVLIRFRRKKGEEDKIPEQVEGSHKLEIIWTIIPIILILILAVPTVAETFNLGDVSERDKVDKDGNRENLVINVRASLYWWEFEYPDQGIVTSQDLVVPTDEKIYFNLIASDVKHAFWIPAIGGKIDTNTDNENSFYLVFDGEKADEAGNIFYGKCAELCGPSHAYMDFKVKAVPRAEFDEWVVAMQNFEEPEPQTAVAQQGKEIFENSCIGCHAVSAENSMPAEARIAPNLADFGNRTRVAGILPYTKENIKEWIQNPGDIKPGNLMYDSANFSEEELDALAEYLMSLKAQE
ncbi:cytochrome c oxidase subunit II [Pallidibacillus pasinlerensis]|uniref:Cytochrome c oxidase subunit 2 n=1 Tax=Pallidibacillus pasinlerensis TaxID=2703818 RepID=A0ABW9ZY93_9BACI|nr:cytochrome c oxidase subunit II [Pallidibacillus pasinlerensis]NCU16158.1 cytochrome c oxidase subunit II [Pallidibacillus pasinlerensis]